MAVTAWKEPSAVASVSGGGGFFGWSNTDRAKTYNSQGANVTLIGAPSYWLRSTSYGFTSLDIPVGATINGIEIMIYRWASKLFGAKDNSIYLRKASGQTGSNLADTVTVYPGSNTAAIYGGAADMCGTTLTQADIIASTFGLDLMVDPVLIVTSYIDVCQIRIYYTSAASQIKKYEGVVQASINKIGNESIADVKKLMGVNNA